MTVASLDAGKVMVSKLGPTLNLVLIPQGTVDNNPGLDRLAGPKALDPNYCRQPTLCLEVLTVHGTELHCFPHTHTIKQIY